MKVVLSLRWFATSIVVTFVLTFVLGALVTFTATDYSSSTDLIYRFYNTFNPCIFFDHYPSNMVTMMGLFFITVSIVSFFLIQYFYVYLTSNASLFSGTVFFGAFALFLEFCFLNVFSSGLYTQGQVLVAPSPGQPAVNSEEASKVIEHSLWYMGFLVAEFFFLLTVMFLDKHLRKQLIWSRKLAYYGMAFVLIVGLLNLFLTLATYDSTTGKNYKDSTDKTYLQTVVYAIAVNLKTPAWHWLPILIYRFMIPKETALVVRLSVTPSGEFPAHLEGYSLQYQRTESFAIDPDAVMSWSARILAALMIGAYLFGNPEKSDSFRIALFSGFRERPYNLIFLPVWQLVCYLVFLSTSLILVRLYLSKKESFRRLRLAIVWTIILMTSLILGCWLSLTEVTQKGYQISVFIFLFPLWILTVYQYRNYRVIAFVICWYAASITAAVTYGAVSTVFNAFVILLLILFNFFMPQEESNIQIQLSIHGAVSQKADTSTATANVGPMPIAESLT